MTGSTEDEATFLRLVGRRVRLLCAAGELTQQHLAETPGQRGTSSVPSSGGRRGGNVLVLRRLATALGVPPAELVDEATEFDPLVLAHRVGSDFRSVPRRR
jgi:transcriptional regulator with XRE-family HTH domain